MFPLSFLPQVVQFGKCSVSQLSPEAPSTECPTTGPVVYTDLLLRETLTVASLISGLMINDVGLVWHHVQVTETLKSKKVVVCFNQLSGLVVRSLVVDHYNPFRFYVESIGSSCKLNFLHVAFIRVVHYYPLLFVWPTEHAQAGWNTHNLLHLTV